MSTTLRPTQFPAGLAEGARTTAESAMDGDFDGARLCLAHVRELAAGHNLKRVYEAAAHLGEVLGPVGTEPGPGLGQAIVDLVAATQT